LISVPEDNVCAQADDASRRATAANNNFVDFMTVYSWNLDASARRGSWVLRDQPQFVFLG
jgi:hypothetical protein